MAFADKYLQKQRIYPDYIAEAVPKDLNLIITIPCFNEPDILPSLEALWNCKRPACSVEVIVVVNSGIHSGDKVLKQNQKTLHEAQNWVNSHVDKRMQFFIMHQPELPKKFFGVGLARKIAMDEAVARFNKIDNPNGIITGFDADSTCDPNYLVEIEKLFTKYPKANGATIYYEHPIEGEEFNPGIYRAITQYELYLRYYIQALRHTGHPHAFHTIGSCFAVKASAYAGQGGMNRRQAGEDFYFLQKIIPLGNFHEINTTRVIPSPRTSDRVPFGTGKAVATFLQENITDFETYNYTAFKVLKLFFDKTDELHKLNSGSLVEKIISDLPNPAHSYLKEDAFSETINEINRNSASLKSFRKKFFIAFSAFKVLKFLNYTHEQFFKKESIVTGARLLLDDLGIAIKDIKNTKELLETYRKLERTNP